MIDALMTGLAMLGGLALVLGAVLVAGVALYWLAGRLYALFDKLS